MKFISILLFLFALGFTILRGHYYHNGLLMTLVYTFLFIPPAVWLFKPLTRLGSLTFSNDKLAGWLVTILYILLVIAALTTVVTLNGKYEDYLLAQETEIIETHITSSIYRGGGRTSRSRKMLVYEYTYNGTNYCNETDAQEGGPTIGDTIKIKVSTFDPTVARAVQ